MEDKKEGWINTGLKPEWEFVEGVKTSNEGMTVDLAYLYHEPIETPIERYARKHGYRLNIKTGEYQRVTDERPRVLKAEPKEFRVLPDFAVNPPDEVAGLLVAGTPIVYDKDGRSLRLNNNFNSVFCETCGKPRYIGNLFSANCPDCGSVMWPVLSLESQPYYIKSCELNLDGDWLALFKYAGYPEYGIDDYHHYMTAGMYVKDFLAKDPSLMTDAEWRKG